MSFSSNALRALAESTLQKFLANVVPDGDSNPKKIREVSAAQSINNQLTAAKLSPAEIKKLHKKAKAKQMRLLKKSQAENTKRNKIAKHQLITKHRKDNTLTLEEDKYLRKIVKRNANLLNRLSEIEDYDLRSELQSLQQDILSAQKPKKPMKNKDRAKDFKEKLQSGKISYPGLTPGLAPVGMDDDDSE